MVHNQQSNLAPSLRPKICSPAACMRLLYVWGRPWPPARGPLLLPTMEGKGPMMALISGYNFVNHVIRSCVPPLIPFIVNEFSFNGSQQAHLAGPQVRVVLRAGGGRAHGAPLAACRQRSTELGERLFARDAEQRRDGSSRRLCA